MIAGSSASEEGQEDGRVVGQRHHEVCGAGIGDETDAAAGAQAR